MHIVLFALMVEATAEIYENLALFEVVHAHSSVVWLDEMSVITEWLDFAGVRVGMVAADAHHVLKCAEEGRKSCVFVISRSVLTFDHLSLLRSKGERIFIEVKLFLMAHLVYKLLFLLLEVFREVVPSVFYIDLVRIWASNFEV